MSKLAKALLETHGVELEPTDVVRLRQNYCEPTIVDVVVEDTVTGGVVTFECFDTRTGVFPLLGSERVLTPTKKIKKVLDKCHQVWYNESTMRGEPMRARVTPARDS